MLKVEMLSTGDEVLYGQIIDTNAVWLSDYLFNHGVPLSFRSTAGDNLDSLIEMLQSRSRHVDVLIVNGGLGPTTDDLSALAAAKANNETLIEHPEWLAKMQEYFAERGKVVSKINRKQAMLPASAELIDNPVGTACGFMMKIGRCLMFFTPGVPSEFKVMVEQQILPRLQKYFVLPPAPLCLRLTTLGRSESGLAALLDPLPLPPDCVLGYRSAMPIIELKLTGPMTQQAAMLKVWAKIKQLVDDHIIFEGTDGLPTELAKKLKQKNLTLTVAEQFTSGLISYQLGSASAPLIASEITAEQTSQSLNQLLKQSYKLASRYKTDLILSSGSFIDNTIMFVLLTPHKSYQLAFNYTSRQLAKATLQETVALLAMNILQRWLLHKNLINPNVWIDVIDNIISDVKLTDIYAITD